MRIPTALAALLFLGTFAPPSLHAPAQIPAQARLWVEAVPLSVDDPDQGRVGRLGYLGGWALSSNDPRFGGISAMHVDAGGVLAVSDAGSVIRFRLPRLGGAGAVEIRPLKEGPGSPTRKSDRDAEAMAVADTSVWIGFENRNEVWRYSRQEWRGDASARPAAMRHWPQNAGSEAMVRLADGRFLLFAERSGEEDDTTPALLFEGDPAERGTPVKRLLYRPPPGYRITDAALLPDGRLLFLNRRIGWLGGVSARLTLGSVPELNEGAVLAGEEIAELKPPLTVDNMEALSIGRENGRTILWIASDDNFSPLQRTLLLKFALAD